MQEDLVVRRETHIPAPPAAVFALKAGCLGRFAHRPQRCANKPLPGESLQGAAGIYRQHRQLLRVRVSGQGGKAACRYDYPLPNAFAKTRGLKTVNIVRRPELVAELEAIGGDVVVIDSPDVPDRIKAAVGQAELRLALDGVGGQATGVLAATLSPHGTLVSFAAMSETDYLADRRQPETNYRRAAWGQAEL